MKDFTKPNSFFVEKHYFKGLLENYKFEQISVLAMTLDYIFNHIEMDFLNDIIKSNKLIGGRPSINYKGCIKLYFLLVYRGMALRDLAKLTTIGSEFMNLLGEDEIVPKPATMTKVGHLIDKNINDIFMKINGYIEQDIGMDKDSLYCDGTVYEAHNSRHKVITTINVEKGLKKWKNKLNKENLTKSEIDEINQKIAKWEEILRKIGRNSYGLHDFDCILIKDKNGSYIAGYNVQLIEENKHGLVIYAKATIKESDISAFRVIVDEIIQEFSPKYFTVDAGYDGEDIMEKFKSNNIQLVVKTRKDNHSQTAINNLSFELNEAEDGLICPNSKLLMLKPVRKTTKLYDHRFVTTECSDCPFIKQCKPIKNKKTIALNIRDFKNIKEIKCFLLTEEGKKIYGKRGTICESPNGFMKYYLKGKKLKRIGLEAVNTTIKILALGYNLTRNYNIKNKI